MKLFSNLINAFSYSLALVSLPLLLVSANPLSLASNKAADSLGIELAGGSGSGNGIGGGGSGSAPEEDRRLG